MTKKGRRDTLPYLDAFVLVRIPICWWKGEEKVVNLKLSHKVKKNKKALGLQRPLGKSTDPKGKGGWRGVAPLAPLRFLSLLP